MSSYVWTTSITSETHELAFSERIHFCTTKHDDDAQNEGSFQIITNTKGKQWEIEVSIWLDVFLISPYADDQYYGCECIDPQSQLIFKFAIYNPVFSNLHTNNGN